MLFIHQASTIAALKRAIAFAEKMEPGSLIEIRRDSEHIWVEEISGPDGVTPFGADREPCSAGFGTDALAHWEYQRRGGF